MSAAKHLQAPSAAVCTIRRAVVTVAIVTLVSFTYLSLKSLHSPSLLPPSTIAPTTRSVQASLPEVVDYAEVDNAEKGAVLDRDREESDDVYHLPKVFRLNYEEMLKRFKVYVYTDGDPKTYYQTPRKLTGKYASEGYFFQNLKDSNFVTDDPDRADLFFIPISCHKMRGKGISYENMTIIVRDYVESLMTKYPYWNRTLGADHFFVACHDVGVRATEGLPNLVKNSIRVVCSPSYDVGFIPHKDVALPQILQPFALPAGGNDIENRTTLGFWAGHRNSKIRVILARVWENDTELDISNNRINRATGHLVYQKRFYRTKFCICPGGSQVNSARITDSIHYGCIPVILSNYYDLPFNDILNWHKFAVVLKEKDVYQLKQILKNITQEEFVTLHNNLVKVQKHFQWNSPAISHDSFHMIIGSSEEERKKLAIRKEKDGWKIDFSGEKPPTPLLDTINHPMHIKNLEKKDLELLATELRAEIVYTVSKTGGHLSSSLGVVELTVALHHVFNTPDDKLIWDVGHQAYGHKILTGRRSKMHTIRQTSGLAGFPKRDESVHDAFGVGHSSTSISAGLGMAVGRDLLGKKNNVVSVIGDGAMTAGQAYEAMNNAGFLDSNIIVVLNDNKQVSLPTATLDGPATPVGAISRALTKLQASPKFRQLREAAKTVTKKIGPQAHEVAAKVDEYARGMISGSGSTFFEELGLYYIGPVDGHNLEDLVTIFQKVKSAPAQGPVLIHIITEKGKGYEPAMAADDRMHGVVKFDPATGKQKKPKPTTLSYTQYFAESLIKEAEVDNKIVAIHAAMGGGTGLNYFQKRFPDRCFDVGIAEQHAVTFAAGLASEGLKPFCAIYSSFLQRGYDQVVHDVDLQKLPVRFAIDRAGLVGADGPTHCGAFDVTYMACLPNMIVMAPSDEAELMHMVATAAAIDDRPSCFRFPRGNGVGTLLPHNNKGAPLEIGKARILMEGSKVAILGYGAMVQECLGAVEMLKNYSVTPTLVDARFCKPLDGDLIKRLAKEHEILVTVEEGSIGGFGTHVAHFLSLNGLLDGNLKLRSMMLPDTYIDHGTPRDQIEAAGLTSKHIFGTILSLMGRPVEALKVQ